MLLLLRDRRTTVYAPSSFLGLSAVLMVGATWRCVVEPTTEAWCAVAFAYAVATFAASLVRVCWVDDGRLRRRSLFSRTELDLARAWVGHAVETDSDGDSHYRIVGDDGTQRVELASAWTLAGAERTAAKLRDTFGIDDAPARAPARRALEDQHEGWLATRAMTKAYVDGQLGARSTRITVLVVLAGLVAFYGLVVAILAMRG